MGIREKRKKIQRSIANLVAEFPFDVARRELEKIKEGIEQNLRAMEGSQRDVAQLMARICPQQPA